MWSVRASILAFAVLTGGLFGPTSALAQEQDCLACHANAALFEGRDRPEGLLIDGNEFEASVHGSLGLDCRTCHPDVRAYPHPDTVSTVGCETCHSEAARAYEASVHGYLLERRNDNAPRCETCHTLHAVRRSDDPESPTHLTRVSEGCGACHGEAGLLTDDIVKLPEMYSSYAASVHSIRGTDGLPAASCVSCHGAHEVRGPGHGDSRISPENESRTCGQCHAAIREEYESSIHGRARAGGVSDSPTCTGCHGEHLILAHDDPEARTAESRMALQACGECHEDEVIIAKYRLQGDVVQSYEDSFHGWVTRGEHGHAATCVSCHTAHFVLPRSDPASTIGDENVVATCAQCHPGANREFAAAYDHVSASIDANPINRAIRAIYVGLIIVVIGGMVAHNVVIMNYFMVEKWRREKGRPRIVRLDRIQLLQHTALTVSFILLVITGFGLRYPEAGWVRLITALGLGEEARALTHRIAAVMLVVISLAHIAYVMIVRRGRQEFHAMLPRVRDMKEARSNLEFHLRRRSEPVRFGRFDYTQKAEYWALVWGTAIMALTGVVLWFPEFSVRVLPYWIVGASQTVHFYEAWLATLAILVWHGFFVIFHPDQYPMSWIWITGRMTEEEARHHHAEWVATMTGEEEA